MEKRRASQVMLVAKNLPVNAGDKLREFNPWVRKNPLRRAWQPTLVFLPGKTHRQRSLEGYSSWDLRVRHNWASEHIMEKCVCVCVCNWVTLLYTWNTVNQLYVSEKRNIIFQYDLCSSAALLVCHLLYLQGFA